MSIRVLTKVLKRVQLDSKNTH